MIWNLFHNIAKFPPISDNAIIKAPRKGDGPLSLFFRNRSTNYYIPNSLISNIRDIFDIISKYINIIDIRLNPGDQNSLFKLFIHMKGEFYDKNQIPPTAEICDIIRIVKNNEILNNIIVNKNKSIIQRIHKQNLLGKLKPIKKNISTNYMNMILKSIDTKEEFEELFCYD